MNTFTLADFLAKYDDLLHAEGYAWTAHKAKRDEFMAKVRHAIEDETVSVRHAAWAPRDSHIGRAAWVALGGKRTSFSLKSLRALPKDSEGGIRQ